MPKVFIDIVRQENRTAPFSDSPIIIECSSSAISGIIRHIRGQPFVPEASTLLALGENGWGNFEHACGEVPDSMMARVLLPEDDPFVRLTGDGAPAIYAGVQRWEELFAKASGFVWRLFAKQKQKQE